MGSGEAKATDSAPDAGLHTGLGEGLVGARGVGGTGETGSGAGKDVFAGIGTGVGANVGHMILGDKPRLLAGAIVGGGIVKGERVGGIGSWAAVLSSGKLGDISACFVIGKTGELCTVVTPQ